MGAIGRESRRERLIRVCFGNLSLPCEFLVWECSIYLDERNS
jgi:hypothetical protein